MKIIFGIDPGSRVTGYGVIASDGRHYRYIDGGNIRVGGELAISERLHHIDTAITALLKEHQPTQGVIEQVFLHRNASSALKLGQARGVAICALARKAIPVAEYSARQVKQGVVGYGAATKSQVQQMVKVLLKLPVTPPTDAADALALALFYAQNMKMLGHMHSHQLL